MARISKRKTSAALEGTSFMLGAQENQSPSCRSRRRKQTEQAQRRRRAKKRLRHHLEELTEENRLLSQQLHGMGSKSHEELIKFLRQRNGECQLQVAGGSSHGEKHITEMDEEKHERDEQGLWEINSESAADEKSRQGQDTKPLTVPGAMKTTLIRDLEERLQDQEAQWQEQKPFNERTHETVTTMSRELQALKADIHSLKTEMKQ